MLRPVGDPALGGVGRLREGAPVGFEQVAWRETVREVVTATSRILLVDAPLCPFRLGRQPQRSDRTEPWEE